MTSVEAQIRDRVQQFVEELTCLVREAAMDAVGQALGNSGVAAPARRGRPLARKVAAGQPATRKHGRRGSSAAVDAAAVLSAISTSPGIGVTEIAAGMRLDSSAVKPAVAELLAGGQIRKTGVRRGTKYHPKR